MRISGKPSLLKSLKLTPIPEKTLPSSSKASPASKAREGLKRQGLDPSPVLESDYKIDGGVSAVSTLLRQPSFPTAILCGNDLTAMGAMSALEDVGVRVPEDVSVIGFDDIFFARLARPPLTTINIPLERLGRMAFEALEKMARSKRQRGVEKVLETALVIRKSTAPSRKHDLRLASPDVLANQELIQIKA